MINRILEKIIDVKSLDLVSILGVADCNLKLIQSVIPVSIIARGHSALDSCPFVQNWSVCEGKVPSVLSVDES